MNPSPKMRGFLFDLNKCLVYICKRFDEALIAQQVRATDS